MDLPAVDIPVMKANGIRSSIAATGRGTHSNGKQRIYKRKMLQKISFLGSIIISIIRYKSKLVTPIRSIWKEVYAEIIR